MLNENGRLYVSKDGRSEKLWLREPLINSERAAMSPKRPPAALRILPIVRLLAAIRALPETVSNLIAARSELIRGSLGSTRDLAPGSYT